MKQRLLNDLDYLFQTKYLIMRKLLIIILTIFLFNTSFRNYQADMVIPEFLTAKNPTKELVYDCAIYYGLQYPEIIVAQSILETGHYKSKGCTEHNNLFGLYDSKNKRYFRFNSWQESVQAYKKMIQYKYDSGDYYAFLERIGYAEDPEYINKVKKIKELYVTDS